MRLTEIRKNVPLVEFDTRYMCAATMMRVQEFYESPFKNIQGRYFTVEEYMDTYATAKGKFTYKDEDYVYRGKGNFTYFMDWEAFNIPGYVLVKFRDKFSGEFTEKENHLINLLKPFMLSEKKFYLIAVVKGEKYLSHELAHAYYYLNEKYHAAMDEAMSHFKKANVISKCILSTSSGYSVEVVKDEIQAYMATGNPKNINEDIGFKVHPKEQAPFKTIFKWFEDLK